MNILAARKITTTMMLAFPRDELTDDEAVLFATEIALLVNDQVALEAMNAILRGGDHFPTIRQFRDAYRSANERHKAAHPALEAGRTPIPEWVHVWKWMRWTKDDWRWLPQQASELHPWEVAISMDEYEEVHREWVKAGMPKASSAAEAVGL